MANCSCSSTIKRYGVNPANIQWNVVRGDTATLRIDFLQSNETTPWVTTGWTYKATAFDSSSELLDDLVITEGSGYVTITAPASTTINWGNQYKSVVAELQFDLEVTIPQTGEDYVWTPVIGTICVLGDVTGGSL